MPPATPAPVTPPPLAPTTPDEHIEMLATDLGLSPALSALSREQRRTLDAAALGAVLSDAEQDTIDALRAERRAERVRENERTGELLSEIGSLRGEKRDLEIAVRHYRTLYERTAQRLEQVVASQQRPVGVALANGHAIAVCANGSAWRLEWETRQTATSTEYVQVWTPLPPVPSSPAALAAEPVEGAHAA